MNRDRVIQIVAALVLVAGTGTSAALLPAINREAERSALRYTDVAVEGAPPFVAVGTMIGALRGIIVDALWIKVTMMKEKGLYYEVMADAELITKLQPRFAAVWAFQGHNMAYNISVATNTKEERWEWVRSGIDLVRNQGLRYNPNDLVLYKELSFWFAHKIDGYTDDAHPFYKREFAREWHYLLGVPPDDLEERVAWIKAIADAPETLQGAERQVPGTAALAERLRTEVGRASERGAFDVERDLVDLFGEWDAIRTSPLADIMGVRTQFRQSNPVVDVLDTILAEVEDGEAWKLLLAHLRKRRLVDRYNMRPQFMYEYTRDLGPIDWRNASAHSLYWSRTGSRIGERRQANDDDIYKILNNDRLQLQAMQALARYGRTSFDPFSPEMPGRLPDSRWIDTITDEFERVIVKHHDTRGAGGESFIGFFENFMSSSVRELWRAGYVSKAQEVLNVLDYYFGMGPMSKVKNGKYLVALDIFAWRQTQGEYALQPHLAQSDLFASLFNGFVNGVMYNEPDVLRDARRFAAQVTEFYEDENAFITKLNEERMGALVDSIETMEINVLRTIMTDRTIPLDDRMVLWRRLDQVYPGLRPWVYDFVRGPIEQELAQTPLGQRFTIDEVLPPPPDLERARAIIKEGTEAVRAELRRVRERAPVAR